MTDGRSPHGESGLKLDVLQRVNGHLRSLSSRRAWIEIYCRVLWYGVVYVALLTESVD